MELIFLLKTVNHSRKLCKHKMVQENSPFWINLAIKHRKHNNSRTFYSNYCLESSKLGNDHHCIVSHEEG